MSNVNTGGVVRQVLYQGAAPKLDVAAVVRQTLYEPPIPSVVVAAVVRQTLYPGFAVVRACVFM
jgi:hypothetical protein